MDPGTPVATDRDRQRPGTAILIDQLRPPRIDAAQHRAGCETWTCAWAPDGSYFAWSCGNNIVKLIPWDRLRHCTLGDEGRFNSEDQSVKTFDCEELVWAVDFGSDRPSTLPNSVNLDWCRFPSPPTLSPGQLVLATGLHSGRIIVWRVCDGSKLSVLRGHTDVIRSVSYSRDGRRRLVSASRDGTLRVWGRRGGTGPPLPGAPSKWMYACCWAPDSTLLASVGDNMSVILWDMVTLTRRRTLSGHAYDVCGCDFSPDGALLVTSSYDTRAIVWDVHLGSALLELRHVYPAPNLVLAAGINDAYIRAVSFSSDGRHISTVSDDGYIRFWDIFSSELPRQVATVTTPLCCRFSPDGAVLAVGTRNGIVTMWMAPMQVSSLRHLCRLSIRRLLPSDRLDSPLVPVGLRRFLAYELPW